MKVMMTDPIAGHDFSFAAGEIVDLAEQYGDRAQEIGAAWKSRGLCVDAPSDAVAAQQIASLSDAVENLTRERLALQREIDRLRGDVAEQKSLAKTAKAEAARATSDLNAARESVAALEKDLRDARVANPATPPAADPLIPERGV